jgi:hypothetical protein
VFSKPDAGFDYNQIFNLLKYLEGWRNRLRAFIGEHNKHAADLKSLNELIAFVEGRMAASQMVTRDDFLAKFRSLHHRILLMPFF